MKIKKINLEEEQPTHLLAVTKTEMWALRRATEAYLQDEHRARLAHYKPTLSSILTEFDKVLDRGLDR